MTRQPNTRQKIIAAGLSRALADSDEFVPGSAARVARWLDLRGPRCIAVGRVINGGAVELFAPTNGDEYQFLVVDDEKLCKPNLGADPDYLEMEG